MWIVEIALRRPYTFIVMALLILLATPLALQSTPTDILPEINIPVVSIIWTYNGLSAQEMGQRIANASERGLTTTVSDIEHVESQSLTGITIIKIFFQSNVNIQTAIAQVVASSQAQVRQLPPGITPPLVILYSASSIPVIQLGLAGPTLSEQQLNDIAVNGLRPQLVTIPGAAVPFPYGGKTRVVSVDIDTQALLARGLTPTDVVNAVNAQNLILPGGTAKIGGTEFSVRMNGSPETIAGLNEIPVRTQNGATTFLREVAHVRDGFQPQTNIVRQDGRRGVLLSVLKNGSSSTLEIVNELRARLPLIAQSLPKELVITPLFDQSVFVKAAIQGVVHEAAIAAILTAAMILLFLGNWRSTCIIAVSIPLSIFASLLMLHALGQTINIMTLGGLALAVGILVDDATVTIENIERHLHLGTDLHKAILDGAGEIAVPALVSTLCICIVFVPMFFLTGVAKYLFVPLAEAVVFAMLASYVLSRTLVPTLVMLLMANHDPNAPPSANPNLLQRTYQRFDRRFERLRGGYIILISGLLARRNFYASLFLGFAVLSCGLFLVLGRDFFPSVDAGQIRLHMRAPTGTQIEETARLADQVETVIREVIPKQELVTILDNLGVPNSGINLSYSNAGTIGTLDGEILISLTSDHRPTAAYVERLRAVLPQRFPGVEFGGAAKALFTLAQTETLKVYVYVPQAYAQLIKTGASVDIMQAELHGQTFKGTVMRSAGAIDAVSRTLQIEVSLPNAEGKLLAGTYVNVAMPTLARQSMTVPTNSLLLRAEGPRIGVVEAGNRVRLHAVDLGADYGQTVEILGGIKGSDQLIVNPSDSLADGDVVVVADKKTPAPAAKPL